MVVDVEMENILDLVVIKHFKVELATGKGEEFCGGVPIGREQAFGVFVDEEIGVNMLADLERQGQEGRKGVYTDERAKEDTSGPLKYLRVACSY